LSKALLKNNFAPKLSRSMKIFNLLLTGCILFFGCESKRQLTSGEGYVEVTGGKIWYQVVGEGDKTPLLLLHGGPGNPAYYLKPLSALAKDRPVITFHQLGCGRSDRITDTTLMTMNNNIEQIDRLLKDLQVDDFYLYGHSWGTMLGVDYYLRNSSRVKGIIFSGPCLSAKLWIADADTLISTLPDSVRTILQNNIQGVEQDSLTLARAVDVYSANFYQRKRPVSAEVDSTHAQTGYPVYYYMWGTNEFFSTGTLKHYDRTGDLNKIKVPVLYITGEYDAARPTTVKYYQSLTPNSQLKVTSNAGHMTMQDNPAEDLAAISEFLNRLDGH
jgi:proline iminopeptidase